MFFFFGGVGGRKTGEGMFFGFTLFGEFEVAIFLGGYQKTLRGVWCNRCRPRSIREEVPASDSHLPCTLRLKTIHVIKLYEVCIFFTSSGKNQSRRKNNMKTR